MAFRVQGNAYYTCNLIIDLKNDTIHRDVTIIKIQKFLPLESQMSRFLRHAHVFMTHGEVGLDYSSYIPEVFKRRVPPKHTFF